MSDCSVCVVGGLLVFVVVICAWMRLLYVGCCMLWKILMGMCVMLVEFSCDSVNVRDGLLVWVLCMSGVCLLEVGMMFSELFLVCMMIWCWLLLLMVSGLLLCRCSSWVWVWLWFLSMLNVLLLKIG